MRIRTMLQKYRKAGTRHLGIFTTWAYAMLLAAMDPTMTLFREKRFGRPSIALVKVSYCDSMLVRKKKDVKSFVTTLSECPNRVVSFNCVSTKYVRLMSLSRRYIVDLRNCGY